MSQINVMYSNLIDLINSINYLAYLENNNKILDKTKAIYEMSLKCIKNANNIPKDVNSNTVNENSTKKNEIAIKNEDDERIYINRIVKTNPKSGVYKNIAKSGHNVKCIVCSNTFDINHSFLLKSMSKHICFNCSLNYDKYDICDWEIKGQYEPNIIKCYRCNTYKSNWRFTTKCGKKSKPKKTIKNERSNGEYSYCLYCKLKGKFNKIKRDRKIANV